jgi:hypothetical protein
VYEANHADFVSRLEVFSVFDPPRKTFQFRRPEADYLIAWNQKRAQIEIERNGRQWISIPVAPVLRQIDSHLARRPSEQKPRTLPQSVLTLRARNRDADVTIYFDDVSGERTAEQIVWNHFRADLFVKILKR